MSYLRSDGSDDKATVEQIEQLFLLGDHESILKQHSSFNWLRSFARAGDDKPAPGDGQELHHTALHDIPSWAQFDRGHGSPHYVSAMASLQDKFEAVRNDEVCKALKKKGLKNLSDEDQEAVHAVTKDIVNDLLHGPISYMRSAEVEGDRASLQQVEQLFMLGK